MRVKIGFTILFLILISFTGELNTSAQTCGNIAPRLVVGEQARITPGPPNILRAAPGVSGDYIGEVPGGEWVQVLDGPRCGSGYYWWLVRYGDLEGWTVEGADGVYYIDPPAHIPTHTFTPTATPTMTYTPSQTPTITPTPSVTPTFVPLLQTAEAQNSDLHVDQNAEWGIVSKDFDGVEMVLVPAGCYNRAISEAQIAQIDYVCQISPAGQGSANNDFACVNREEPTLQSERVDQEICFTSPFWIDRHEVSNLQYETVGVGGDPEHPFNYVRWGDNHPRVYIEYSDAVVHCLVRGGRLLTDVEWEYAGRGPDSLLFPWGNEFSTSALYYDTVETHTNSDGSILFKTAPVNSETVDQSWVGAYYMSSNVDEYVTNTLFEKTSADSMRGGHALNHGARLRLTFPLDHVRTVTDLFTGFRCMREFSLSDLDSTGTP